MLKSKGAVIGVAVAVVGAALLAAGLAVSTTSGAGTDDIFTGAPTGEFPEVIGPAPAAPTDPSIPGTPGTTPGTDAGNPAGIPASPTSPDGGAGAGGTSPDALPNAGLGGADSGSGFGAMVALLAIAGAALIGAGATAVSAGRRD
jgi:hypothetical protein